MASVTGSPIPMQYRRRLRSRIILSFALLGTGLTASFALATVFLRAHLENQIIGEALEKNLEGYASSFYRSPDIEGVPFEQIEGRVFSKRRFGNVPLAWRALDSGVHDLTERAEDRKLGRAYWRGRVCQAGSHSVGAATLK